MTKDIITSVIILLLLIAFALWSIARSIKESAVDVTFSIDKMSAEIRRARESIDGLQKETAKLRIRAMKDKPDGRKVEEIVRCKDCEYQTESWSGIKYCEAHGDHIGKDYDYCSNARRKENEQTDFTASCD